MQILLSPNLLLSEIQDRFHKKYPFLKLEFFALIHESYAPSVKESMLNATTKVSQLCDLKGPEFININGHLKVATFEKNIQDILGIGVQVFRKAGQTWIQTTTTDEWTLTKQNEHGKATRKVTIHC